MVTNEGVMEQQSLPLAYVRGEKMIEKPKDLFIPDDALAIRLANFEGPLDLLLYLIKKQKFDITDLPIAPISEQYLKYIEAFERHSLDLSSEYLVMAATLALIKSKLLLPKPVLAVDEEDPRAELVRRLQEYQRIKDVAQLVEELPRVSRDYWLADVEHEYVIDESISDISLTDLVQAFNQVLKKQAAYQHHHVQKEAISTQDKMSYILSKFNKEKSTLPFSYLLDITEGRQGAVATFLALLELLKANIISVVLDKKRQLLITLE